MLSVFHERERQTREHYIMTPCFEVKMFGLLLVPGTSFFVAGPPCTVGAISQLFGRKFKGIFQPFELGGVTRLIRSAVKFWKAGNKKKEFLMIQTHERSL
jgi:hypothetical protein